MGRNNKASNYDPILYNTPIYRCWYNMKTRCLNPKATGFHLYGGRGIKVCEYWLRFDGFLADMQASYFDGALLDRIDNNGNYEPGNCRWTDIKTQCRNRSTNRLFTLNGITKTLAEWSEFSESKPSTIRQRLYCYGWSIEDSLKPIKF